MNNTSTAIGAIVLIVLIGLGIWLYNRSHDAAPADDMNSSTLNVDNSLENIRNSTTSPYNNSFEPTAS